MSAGLWQYYRDEPALTNGDALDNFPGKSALFEFKQKIIVSTGNDGTQAVQIMVPLKHLSNFWRTLETLLINCEINLILTWSANCVTSNAAVNHASSGCNFITQGKAKLLQQLLKRGFQRIINWNKYHSKTKPLNGNPYLDFLIDRCFQRVIRVFVLPFNDSDSQIEHSRYYVTNAKVKD